MSISTNVFTSYKKIDEAAADALLMKEIAANSKKIVILDDDPTGGQTIHDLHEYTSWDHDSIKAGFEEENNLFYVLTNSRGFTVEKTTKALAIKCVNVLGQIRPGVPVWQTGDESKFPQTPYVIFPGNVGESTTLREAVEVLSETPLS